MSDQWPPTDPYGRPQTPPPQPAYVSPSQHGQRTEPDYPLQGGPTQPWMSPPIQPPRKRAIPIWVWIVAVVVVLATITTVIVWKGRPATITVSGQLSLKVTDPAAISGNDITCRGADGYDDIAGGAQVVVYDSKGASLAVGALDQGSQEGIYLCTFAFHVSGVPAKRGPYSVEVSHRGKIAFDEAGAADVEVSLGT